jgi:hypothetical protein
MPVGIVPAMDFDAGHDAGTVGIEPAMPFDAGQDGAGGSSSGETSSSASGGS